MKQNPHYLLIAALVLAGVVTVSCGKQLDEPQPQDSGRTVTLTSTIGLDAPTKALTALGEKTFAKDDQIAVIYKQKGGNTAKALSNALTDSDIYDGGRKANITVTLDNLTENGAIRYIYPAGMALATVATDADVNSDAATIDFTQLDAQDGTLETLAANYDLSVFDGTFNGSELPESALLSNQLAIGEFTIKNTSGNDITNTVTGLKVTDGTNTYTVSRAAADGPVYVAMLPVANTETLTFIATDNAATPNHFIKMVSGKALARNNMYPVRLTMYPALDVSELTGTSITIADGYWLYGIQASSVQLRIADEAHVTLAGVTITPSHAGSGLECKGSTTITLAAGTINHVASGTGNGGWNYAGIQVGPTNKTLTIDGEGTLIAECTLGEDNLGHGAGIGACYNKSCGNIVILGGNIDAAGGCYTPGIGSGFGSNNSKKSVCGDITISGGTVTAVGGSADGIGCGTGAYCRCGAITITEGARSVTAIGDRCIGERYSFEGYYNRYGTITIDGHVLTEDDRNNPEGLTFTHFNSEYVYDSEYDESSWILTHK